MKQWIVGQYQYIEMKKPKYFVVRYREKADIDFVPCTAFKGFQLIYAKNAKDAVFCFKVKEALEG